jgi:hypothetical protein
MSIISFSLVNYSLVPLAIDTIRKLG